MTAQVPAFLGPLIEIAGEEFEAFDLPLDRALPLAMPPQQLSNWCWAATTACIQAFYQEPDAHSQCQIASYWLAIVCCPPGPDVESNPQNRRYNLATALDRNLASPPLAAAADRADVQHALQVGQPICCAIQWSNGDIHFNVIADYLPQTDEIVIRDPKYGDQQVSYDIFCNHYRNDGRWVATVKTRKA